MLCPLHSRVTASLATLAVVTSLSACSTHRMGRPWLKPASQWTAEEAGFVWNHSPWAKRKRIRIKGPQEGFFYPEFYDAGCQVEDHYPCPPEGCPFTCSTGSRSVRGTRHVWTDEVYRIRWISSRMMGQAIPPNAAWSTASKLCSQSGETYKIAVERIKDSPHGPNHLDLGKHSHLIPRHLGYPVLPQSAGTDPRWPRQFVLVFPSRTKDGRLVIAPNETVVEFVLSDGKHEWKVKFRPQEMTGPNGPDW